MLTLGKFYKNALGRADYLREDNPFNSFNETRTDCIVMYLLLNSTFISSKFAYWK